MEGKRSDRKDRDGGGSGLEGDISEETRQLKGRRKVAKWGRRSRGVDAGAGGGGCGAGRERGLRGASLGRSCVNKKPIKFQIILSKAMPGV